MIDSKILSTLFRGQFLSKANCSSFVSDVERVLVRARCERYLSNASSVADVFVRAYQDVFDQYKCEYVYKNSILNRIFLSRHSLDNSAYITEFACGAARVDVAIFNGTSTAYEIKTEYDSFDKLEKQLSEYLKVFDKVYVVTSESRVSCLEKAIPDRVGILSLKGRGQVSKRREGQSNKSNVDPCSVFDCLRKSEYLAIIKKITGASIDLPNGIVYSECRKTFSRFSSEIAHDAMVAQLRCRRPITPQIDLLNLLPVCMKQAWLDVRAPGKQLASIAKAVLTPL